MFEYDDTKDWNTVYQEMSHLIGKKHTLELYQAYKGTQLTFPMRLVSADKLKRVLEREHRYYTSKELARVYGYSERHISRIIHDIKKERGNKDGK